jgi:hypothetical protein
MLEQQHHSEEVDKTSETKGRQTISYCSGRMGKTLDLAQGSRSLVLTHVFQVLSDDG